MPFCVIKSRTIKIFLVMVALAVLLSISYQGGASALVWFGYSSRMVPVYKVDTAEKQVAISFDAAWGADKTEEIISLLGEYNCKGTFFLVGFWVDKYPDMVKKINDAGLEIGSHSNTHPDMAKLSKESIRSELSTSISKIENLTGKKVEVFRPPYGSYSNNLLSVCKELNLIAVQWDVDSLDWKGLSASEITDRVTKRVGNGSIILMHNNADHVVDALKLTLEYLTKNGYKVTTVGDLVYKDSYTIDANGIQHKK